jgi:hypothetical protein
MAYLAQVERVPATGKSVTGDSPRVVLRGLVARLSHLPKSETEDGFRRNAPQGDAEPMRSVGDDNAEKWAANR